MINFKDLKESNTSKYKKGSWYNKEKGESLHPDLDPSSPIKPHWDYKGPKGEKSRLYTDGTWEWME